MKWMHWSIAALLAVAVLGFNGAQANELSELVAARDNARAGGPLNERDAELLRRYGALSGTPGYKGYGKTRPHLKRHRRGRRY